MLTHSRRFLPLMALLVALGACAAPARAVPLPASPAGGQRALLAAGDGDVQAAIVGGAPAKKGRFPYMAALRQNTAGEPLFCGGTLIASQVVMSAAHCFFNTKTGALLDASYTRPKVRIGGFEEDGGTYEKRSAVALLLPSIYDEASHNFDVALLLLDAKSSATPVRIAPGRKKADRMRAGTFLYALGWGKLAWAGDLPAVLQEAPLDYISLAKCATFAPNFDWQRNSMLCAGSPHYRRNACSGDSGGPLLRKGRSARADVQLGIVSWGWSCGEGKPGVYTDVGSVRGFVDFGIRKLTAPPKPKPKPRPKPVPKPQPRPWPRPRTQPKPKPKPKPRPRLTPRKRGGAAGRRLLAAGGGSGPPLSTFWRRV